MKHTAIPAVLALATLVAGCSSTPPVEQEAEPEALRPVNEVRDGEFDRKVISRNPMTVSFADVTVHRAILTNGCVYGYNEEVDTTAESHGLLTVDMTAELTQGEPMVLDQAFIEYGDVLSRSFPTSVCTPADGASDVRDLIGPEETRVTGTYVVDKDATSFIIGGERFPIEEA